MPKVLNCLCFLENGFFVVSTIFPILLRDAYQSFFIYSNSLTMGNQQSEECAETDEDVDELMGILNQAGCQAIKIPPLQPELDKEDTNPSSCCRICYKNKAIHAFVPCGCRAVCNHCASNFPEVSDAAECALCKKPINQIA